MRRWEEETGKERESDRKKSDGGGSGARSCGKGLGLQPGEHPLKRETW